VNTLPTDTSSAAELEKAPDCRNREEQVELVDMGDAVRETKQVAPAPFFADSLLGMGMRDW
jgi:hypothetical protein